MKTVISHIILILACLFLVSQPVLALDSAQKDAMNKAITGKSGTVGISSSYLKKSSSTSTYSDGVLGVRTAITLIIAAFYLLFVAWLGKSQYIAWAEGDVETGEAFGSLVMACLILLLIMFIINP
ncbi:MAG: DUF3262 family protein [gamma proteobacterium symbiont of Lucinoma myriamae]|nr:DUF3262 family protein [gamma proteobacterium symbiont of Lucinoma myriamae]MCU7817780.1 DUF3262 family protein [gamma proteobacterium symbiont of Lucinoma myriamae]MCU7833369.1 DUF3262 family protein [gamma proteobacterium symbiont of Lucinoma myriamae]